MNQQEINYINENTTLLSIFVKFIQFINQEIESDSDDEKEKYD